MQWSLVAVIHIVNALFGASCASAENGKGQISRVFEAFGYSPACVASALTSCEFSSTKELSVDVVDTIEGTKSLLQEMKSERENFSSVLKFLLQEMKSVKGNSVPEIKFILQEIMYKADNSSSEVKTLLQQMKSEISNEVSGIKLIRQELKSAVRQEMQSERENSASILNSLLQEIKSEEKNSSSVMKALLQEMKSERENSVSEIKATLQEVKRELENVTENSQTRDCGIPGGTTNTPEGKKLPKNCAELKMLGETSSGVQTVYPYGSLNPKQTTVYCDQVTDGGGWTVIQSRSPLPVRENFTRNGDEYVKGFGDLKGEFWLGLDNIHALTNSAQMELLVEMQDAEGKNARALYSTFHVGDAASKYVLRIGGYSGTAGDAMTNRNYKDFHLNTVKFSTFDRDNDDWSGVNCAERHKGGWWFNSCSFANLNGLPIVGEAPNFEGILWVGFSKHNYSLKKASMKIRPVSGGF